jgi:hypothetical protein
MGELEEGAIKLTSNRATREEDGVASSGGVARDSLGFRGAWCKLYRQLNL